MNRQTKLGKNTKPQFCVRNGGANPIISPIQHGKFAFQEPAKAVQRKKAEGSKSWRVTGRHPNANTNKNNNRNK